MFSSNVLVVIAVVALAGCAAPAPDTVQGTPPVETEVVQRRYPDLNPKSTPEPAPQHSEPVVTYDGWPFNDEDQSFRVTWGGGKEQIPLYASPSLNAKIVAQGSFERDQEMLWTQTSVAIFRPSRYRVKSQVLVEGFMYGDAYRTGSERYSETLAPGEVVRVFHYTGQGMCLVSVRMAMVEIPCPTAEHFAGNFKGRSTAEMYQPAESIWWLYVNSNSGSGWMPLDDRVLVDIE